MPNPRDYPDYCPTWRDLDEPTNWFPEIEEWVEEQKRSTDPQILDKLTHVGVSGKDLVEGDRVRSPKTGEMVWGWVAEVRTKEFTIRWDDDQVMTYPRRGRFARIQRRGEKWLQS